MGIYGNITDMSRTHFQFDKIFSSRYEMDTACASGNDNIFSGRFVLVKYDKEGKLFNGETGYINTNNPTAVYVDNNYTSPYIYTTFSKVNNPVAADWNTYYYYSGKYYYKLPSEYHFNSQEENYYTADSAEDNLVSLNQIIRIKNSDGVLTDTYYKCTGSTVGAAAVFEPVILDNEYLEYFTNYNLDKVEYGQDFDIRGYDATVWQKIYSEGQGRFILIAYLNGAFPKIEFYSDPPSNQPSGLSIDSKSTDAVYRLHLPSQWGFRIKEAESSLDENENLVYALSDQILRQRYYEYDNNNNPTSSTDRMINAEIYFNKDGTTKIERHFDNSTTNEILISPTGESGKVYYDNNGNRITIDTYELAIHLPIIGNVISDFYDLLYGQDRKLDTVWYDGNSSMIETGNPLLGGKTRDLNTAAGLINTFQDRLGQIIIPLDSSITNTQAALLDNKYIYSVETNDETLYYRIGKDYVYTEIPEYSSVGILSNDDYTPSTYYILDNENNYILATDAYGNYQEGTEFYRKNISYTQVSLTSDSYIPNTYYLDSSGINIATEGYNYYPNNQNFYKKNISVFKYQKINLTKYEEGHYYYQSGNNYILDRNHLVPSYKSQPYYNITSANEVEYTFDASYYPNNYYTKENDCYVLASELVPDPLKTYYGISASSISNNEDRILYQPNIYYYYSSYQNGEPVGNPILDTNDTMTSGRIYWYIPLSSTPVYVVNDGQIIVGYALDVDNKQQVNLFFPSGLENINDIYIRQDTTYIPMNQVEDFTVAYNWFLLTAIEIESYFLPGEYYRKDENGYYLQNTWSGDNTMTYLKLVNLTTLPYPFYEADKYFYYNGNIYLIDTAITMTDNRDYYIGKSLYVLEDYTNRWPYGFEWREQALFVPASVTLATREEISKAFELKGIDNGESSINGSILSFNQCVSQQDFDNRDTTTLTGAINVTKDLLQSVNMNLIPGRLLYVNDFGQISVSSITLSQLENIINNS